MSAMDELIELFQEAKQYHGFYVAIKVSMEGFPEEEVIINKNENIDSKLEYYKNTYDQDLNHKFAKGIKITDFTYGESFDVIEYELLH